MSLQVERPDRLRVLVTGGGGYIGSHTVLGLLEAGHYVEIVDDLSNGHLMAVKNIGDLTGASIQLHEFDLSDAAALERVFAIGRFDACIHFAGYKSVAESIQRPAAYYRNNIVSTLSLIECMERYSVSKLIFSSSASVYGDPVDLPILETSVVGRDLSNPYGRTKYMIEQILTDIAVAQPNMSIAMLRYFNPIGAHPSGLIGEDPRQIPNNLAPYITQVAAGIRGHVTVFGDQYETLDGTGIRDYVHVLDLADGHVASLEKLKPGIDIFNLGTGIGTSVLELIGMFSQVVGRNIPYRIVQPRIGDVAVSYADVSKAWRRLGWKSTRTVVEACADAWNWQHMNPQGFGDRLA